MADDDFKITSIEPEPTAPPTSFEDPGLVIKDVSDDPKGKEPWWLKGAEYTVPVVAQAGGDALGAAAGGALGLLGGPAAEMTVPLGAAVGGAAGAGEGNYRGDQFLNFLRKQAGVPEEPNDPTTSRLTGAAGSVVGKYGVPILGKMLSGGGRALLGGPSEEAIGEAGEKAAQEAGKALEKPAGDVAAEVGGAGVQSSLGIDPNTPANERAAAATGDFGSAALAHTQAQDSALAPVGRLFKKKGMEIGQILEPFKELPANTEALDNDGIENVLKKNGYEMSPGVGKILDEARLQGQAGEQPLGEMMGRLNTIQGLLNKPSLKSGDRYVLGQLRDQYQDIINDVDNLPPQVQEQLKQPKAEYRTLKDYFDKHPQNIGSTATPGETGQNLMKLDPRAFNLMVNEATPEESDAIRGSVGRYILGEESTTKELGSGADVAKRFNEIKAANPEGVKKLFGDGPFAQASTWSDLPKMTDALVKGIKDPKLQNHYLDGWQLGSLNTPEAKGMADAMAKLKSLPQTEQARIAGEMGEVSKEKGYDWGRYMKYWLARNAAFGAIGGYGLGAHRPGMMIGAGLAIGARQYATKLIQDNPDLYLKMLRAANSETAQGIYQAGYYGSRLAMYEATSFLNDRLQGRGRSQQPAAAAAPAASPTPGM